MAASMRMRSSLASRGAATMRPSVSRIVAAHAIQPNQQPQAVQLQQCMAAMAAAIMLGCSPVHAEVAETSAPGTNAGFLTNEEVIERRKVLHFTRAFDGKVALQNSKDKLWDVKLDLKSPGTLLLRSPEGAVHYLAYESLTQVDLSDDEVVGAIASSEWETGAKVIEAKDEDNNIQRLELTREGFYDLISIVDP